MRTFLYRSTERRRGSHSNETLLNASRRSSSPGGNLQECRNGRRLSLNTLTVPRLDVRRRSYSGPCSTQIVAEPLTVHRKSSARPLGFNPFVEKLSRGCVTNVLLGMMCLFILVVVASLYRLLT